MTDILRIQGHRVGCPTLTEPVHHGCRMAEDGSIERYTAPSYGDLRAENEMLRAALEEISELELEGDASLADAMHIAEEVLNP